MKSRSAKDPAALRREAEVRLDTKLAGQPAASRPQTEVGIRRLQHELEVHQIELEMQNEELRAARDEIQAGLDRYTDLYEFAPLGYFNLSAEGDILAANLTGSKLIGVERKRLIGQRFESLIVAADRPSFRDFLREVFATDTRHLCEVGLLKPGQPPMILLLEAMLSPDRKDCRMAISDITERKNAEKYLARLEMAVEQAVESIIITDTQGTIVYANPAFATTTGYARSEVTGKNPRFLKSGKHDDAFYRLMWDVLRLGQVWQGRIINRRKDGSLFEEEATISPVRDATGHVINFVAVKYDVTREMQLEAQVRQSQKLEAIGTLAGGVAHDFNNILTTIRMQAELMKTIGALSVPQADLADQIVGAVTRASTLSRQLLLFSRKQVMQPRDLDLNTCVASLTKMLKRVLGENIEVSVRPAAEPMVVHADAGMLDQVLLNLVLNARDAMPGGGRLIIDTASVEFDEASAAQMPEARPGSFVCLGVSDNGSGIPQEILPKIFEPFFTTKDTGKGSGLGLATAYGIVQEHHGWINVRTETGSGTTFKVFLPRLTGTPDLEVMQTAPASLPTGHETILIVEDQAPLRDSIRTVLTRLGYRVLEAANGVKAREIWRDQRDEINLLLTDLMMPDQMNGKDLSRRLLQDKPGLKVIFMSGYGAEIIGPDFHLQPGGNFLAKPFDVHALATIIRTSLDKTG